MCMKGRTISDANYVPELSDLGLESLGYLCLSGVKRILQLFLLEVLLAL